MKGGVGSRSWNSSQSVIVVEQLVDDPSLEISVGHFGNHDVRVVLTGSLEVVVVWNVR